MNTVRNCMTVFPVQCRAACTLDCALNPWGPALSFKEYSATLQIQNLGVANGANQMP